MASRVVMMKRKYRQLHVMMNGLSVGILQQKTSNVLSFSYQDSWLNTPEARPISLSLPLSNEIYQGDKVYNFFDNLLPDNPQVRARIQAKFHAPTNQPFDLLASIGRDCVGAIQIVEDEIQSFKKEILCEPLTDQEIASLLRNYQYFPLGMTKEHDEFRISIAGAQEKTALLFHQGCWNTPLGATPTSHIFKLPIGFIQHQNLDLTDSIENEWLCLEIAKAFGLPTASGEIHYFENVKTLIVKRFDRKLSQDKTWIMRLPQEDFCQALGISSALKYQADGGPGIQESMHLLLGSNNASSDRDIFFKSQILFWLLAGIDGHAKNFSVFLERAGKYRLTPLYDIISAHPLLAKKQLQTKKIKMAMALTGKNQHYHWNEIQPRHFLETAKKIHYSVERAEVIMLEMINQVDSVIEKISASLPKNIPAYISEPIFLGMRKIKQKYY